MPRGTFTFRKVRDGAAMAASGILARRVQDLRSKRMANNVVHWEVNGKDGPALQKFLGTFSIGTSPPTTR